MRKLILIAIFSAIFLMLFLWNISSDMNYDKTSIVSNNTSNILKNKSSNISEKVLIISNSSVIDRFGITEVYNSLAGGREWFSKWDNNHKRAWNDTSNDPDDEEFFTKYKGDGHWNTDGDGILKISGSYPRMYVIDNNRIKSWHNVEITIYGMRISDDNVEYAGIVSVARTNHLIDENRCDTRGYSGRFTLDGRIDFEKEIDHHADNGYRQTATMRYWPGGMPKNVWIGYKFVVYDLSNGNVKLELWMDNTDGLNGGKWILVDEFIDNGKNFGNEGPGCKPNIDPYAILSSSDIRTGSETGKPNLAVYFRTDELNDNGLWYKKASVREITTDKN